MRSANIATSSIVEKIRVNNPKVIVDYVEAMETSANVPINHSRQATARKVTDAAELKELMLRGWGSSDDCCVKSAGLSSFLSNRVEILKKPKYNIMYVSG